MFVLFASIAYNGYQDRIPLGEEQKEFVTRGCTVAETNWLGSPTDWSCPPYSFQLSHTHASAVDH